jgi:hypothetical protein
MPEEYLAVPEGFAEFFDGKEHIWFDFDGEYAKTVAAGLEYEQNKNKLLC